MERLFSLPAALPGTGPSWQMEDGSLRPIWTAFNGLDVRCPALINDPQPALAQGLINPVNQSRIGWR